MLSLTWKESPAARGNFNTEDLIGSFDETEGNRIRKIIGYWPFLKSELYNSLFGLWLKRRVNDQGLQGASVERFGSRLRPFV